MKTTAMEIFEHIDYARKPLVKSAAGDQAGTLEGTIGHPALWVNSQRTRKAIWTTGKSTLGRLVMQILQKWAWQFTGNLNACRQHVLKSQTNSSEMDDA